jgi:purine-binding chemotaxis protein CheW
MAEKPTPDSSIPGVLSETKNTSQFVGFQIDSQHYAIRIEQIQEIVMIEQVTRTPQVADYVEGVTNLRGAIIPIINLRKLLGLSPKRADADTRTIVVNVGQRTMGCTVDAVSQVIRIPQESIQPAPDTMRVGGCEDIAGFAKLDDHLVVLLDIDHLLSPERLQRFDGGNSTTASLTSSIEHARQQ